MQAHTLADIQKKYGESVYPLYKDVMQEPYQEEENGIGYVGTTLYDEANDKIFCGECGKRVKILNHLHLKTHGLDSDSYRKKHQILKEAALCSKGYSKIRSEQATEGNYLRFANHENQQKGVQDSSRIGKSTYAELVGHKNKLALCDAQIESRIRVVAAQVGRVPSNADINKFDKRLGFYLDKNGGLNKYKAKYGITTYKVGNGYTDLSLLSNLRGFVMKNNYIPTIRGFSKETGISGSTVFNHFGSWRRAKMMAGVNQLLAEIKELKPPTSRDIITT